MNFCHPIPIKIILFYHFPFYIIQNCSSIKSTFTCESRLNLFTYWLKQLDCIFSEISKTESPLPNYLFQCHDSHYWCILSIFNSIICTKTENLIRKYHSMVPCIWNFYNKDTNSRIINYWDRKSENRVQIVTITFNKF